MKKAGGEERVRGLLRRFMWLNAVRGAIMAVGAGAGVWAAVAA